MGIDYSRIFYFTMVVTNCARSGAIYGMQNYTTANDQTAIANAAKLDASNLNAAQLTVTSSTDSDTAPTYVIVTVTYPFATLSNFPGIASSTTISRTIRMSVPPFIPLG
jgi:Flp pilus assembly protein TadG